MPPTSAVQTTFSPVLGSHFSGRPFSRLTPVCSGPRHWYQPGRRAVCGTFFGSACGAGAAAGASSMPPLGPWPAEVAPLAAAASAAPPVSAAARACPGSERHLPRAAWTGAVAGDDGRRAGRVVGDSGAPLVPDDPDGLLSSLLHPPATATAASNPKIHKLRLAFISRSCFVIESQGKPRRHRDTEANSTRSHLRETALVRIRQPSGTAVKCASVFPCLRVSTFPPADIGIIGRVRRR